jgi:hypothetical protein
MGVSAVNNDSVYMEYDERPIGPFSVERARQLAINGQISAKTLVSYDRTNWVTAEQLPDLFPMFQAKDYGQQKKATTNESEIGSFLKSGYGIAILTTSGLCLFFGFCIVLPVLGFFLFFPSEGVPSDGPSARSAGGRTQPSGLLGSVKGSQTKKIKLESGTATFTINRSGPHHLRVDFNSGLVAKVNWKENPYNDFGYDIYEPEVSETTNRLAIMIALRAIIANYLKGKYD